MLEQHFCNVHVQLVQVELAAAQVELAAAQVELAAARVELAAAQVELAAAQVESLHLRNGLYFCNVHVQLAHGSKISFPALFFCLVRAPYLGTTRLEFATG